MFVWKIGSNAEARFTPCLQQHARIAEGWIVDRRDPVGIAEMQILPGGSGTDADDLVVCKYIWMTPPATSQTIATAIADLCAAVAATISGVVVIRMLDVHHVIFDIHFRLAAGYGSSYQGRAAGAWP